MNFEKRLEALLLLGEYIQKKDVPLQKAIQRNYINNQWFTPENQWKSLNAIQSEFLNRSKLEAWLEKYPINDQSTKKKVGLILAGNIPLVGFHDFLCVWLSGHTALVKTSGKDEKLFVHLLEFLEKTIEKPNNRFEIVERLKDFDAIIATGSNNSGRYFDYYFGKYPNIIRKNRSSVAILKGDETKEEITALGNDLFDYFGLGCRNVSKIFVPKDFDFVSFLDNLASFEGLMHHNKYKNNYDYNRSILLLNETPHFASDYIMLAENKGMVSPISTLYYEFYEHQSEWENRLMDEAEQIQCVVGNARHYPELLPFGKAQEPTLSDYADNIDTMEFLVNL